MASVDGNSCPLLDHRAGQEQVKMIGIKEPVCGPLPAVALEELIPPDFAFRRNQLPLGLAAW